MKERLIGNMKKKKEAFGVVETVLLVVVAVVLCVLFKEQATLFLSKCFESLTATAEAMFS